MYTVYVITQYIDLKPLNKSDTQPVYVIWDNLNLV